jgi:hypothetical protein
MKPEEAKFQLQMIRPYFNHLRRTVMQDERLKRRGEQNIDVSKMVCKITSGVIFEAPEFQDWVAESKKPKFVSDTNVLHKVGSEIDTSTKEDQEWERLEQIRKDLRLIALSARYDGTGTAI